GVGFGVCRRWLEVGAFALAHVVNVVRVRAWGKLRYRQSNPYAIRRLRKLRRATFFPRESAKSAFAVVAAFWATRTAAERNRTPRRHIKLFMALTSYFHLEGLSRRLGPDSSELTVALFEFCGSVARRRVRAVHLQVWAK